MFLVLSGVFFSDSSQFVDESLFRIWWFGGSGGGRGSGGRVPQPNDSNNVRSQYHSTAEGEGGGRSGGRVPQPNDKARKGPGAANNSRNVGIPNHL